MMSCCNRRHQFGDHPTLRFQVRYDDGTSEMFENEADALAAQKNRPKSRMIAIRR